MSSPLSPLPPLSLWSPLFRAIDMPAREAVTIARRRFAVTASYAAGGFGLLALCTLTAAAIGMLEPSSSPRMHVDALRAAAEALAVIVPAAVVLFTYGRVGIGPRTLLAACAIGLLVGGIVACCTLPLLAFLALVNAGSVLIDLSNVALCGIALGAAASVPYRVLRTFDTSGRSRILGIGFVVALIGAYVLRVASVLGEIL